MLTSVVDEIIVLQLLQPDLANLGQVTKRQHGHVIVCLACFTVSPVGLITIDKALPPSWRRYVNEIMHIGELTTKAQRQRAGSITRALP